MTFPRVNVAGWSVNDILSSAQTNQLDTNVSNAIAGNGPSSGGTYAPSTEIDVTGSGLGRSLPIKSGTLPWDTFGADAGAKRTFKKRILPSPAARVSGPSVSAGAFFQGDGAGWFTTVLDLPDGATITNVRLFFKVATGHVSLPTKAPGVSVQRLKPGASATLTDVLDSADTTMDGKTITFTLPGTVGAWNAEGEIFVDYACNQNNVTDRGQYVFLALAQDENGGGAIAANIFSGWEVTFTLPKFAVDGALQ